MDAVMITDTVGQNGKNYSLDVAKVQKLLNQNLHHLKCISILKVDGVFGEKTLHAIHEYQTKVLKLDDAQGIIVPGRTTIKWLIKTARKPRPQNIDTFIIKILPAVKKIRSKYQVPVSVLIARAALDSEWGKKIHNQDYYKRTKHGAATKPASHYYHADTFDHYSSIFDAAESYGHLLKTNPRYLPIFNYINKPLEFVKKLEEIDYSMKPGDAKKLQMLITKNYLTEFDK